MLQNKRVMLDVNTLLRGILFTESHSARLIQHLEISKGAVGIISPHIQNTAIYKLKRENPTAICLFTTELLTLIKRGSIEVVPDGDPCLLPNNVRFDPNDDDVVMATAISGRCDALATLDRRLAEHASQIIQLLPPSHPECSSFISTLTSIANTRIYAGPKAGSIMLEVAAKEGTTSYTKKSGRRYVFYTDIGFGMWLNEKSWKYQIGFIGQSEPLYTLPKLNQEQPALIAISYHCIHGYLHAGWYQKGGTYDVRQVCNNFKYPEGIGSNWSLLSRWGENSFYGYWRGILTTAAFAEKKALEYALRTRSHFEPLDAQRFDLTDTLIDRARLLTSESSFL